MEITIKEFDGVLIEQIINTEFVLTDLSEVVDLIGNSGYQGTNKIILLEKQLHSDFFNLKTRMAGEILQKFSTYDCRLAIVGDFERYTSNSLRDFIYESNKIGRISFVNTLEQAVAKLSKR